MSRRKQEEEWENHERWLVSYADFITLLFAFFVVMYAISSVNEGKYRVLSETLVSAFTGHPLSPVPVQDSAPSTGSTSVLKLPPVPSAARIAAVPSVAKGIVSPKAAAPKPDAAMQQLQQQMEKLLQPLIRNGSVAIHSSALGVVIDLNAKILFPSGQATLMPEAQQNLAAIAKVLKTVPYQIQVNGFTNDLPIRTAQFPSNWYLSAARAVAVTELFIAEGVNPEHLVAAGYGKYHPIQPNNTAAGLAMNRRVSIVVVAPQNPSKLGQDPI
ncbi:MAG: flagellar motor protein MotD, partial [Acidithiobacillus sp.]